MNDIYSTRVCDMKLFRERSEACVLLDLSSIKSFGHIEYGFVKSKRSRLPFVTGITEPTFNLIIIYIILKFCYS